MHNKLYTTKSLHPSSQDLTLLPLSLQIWSLPPCWYMYSMHKTSSVLGLSIHPPLCHHIIQFSDQASATFSAHTVPRTPCTAFLSTCFLYLHIFLEDWVSFLTISIIQNPKLQYHAQWGDVTPILRGIIIVFSEKNWKAISPRIPKSKHRWLVFPLTPIFAEWKVRAKDLRQSQDLEEWGDSCWKSFFSPALEFRNPALLLSSWHIQRGIFFAPCFHVAIFSQWVV